MTVVVAQEASKKAIEAARSISQRVYSIMTTPLVGLHVQRKNTEITANITPMAIGVGILGWWLLSGGAERLVNLWKGTTEHLGEAWEMYRDNVLTARILWDPEGVRKDIQKKRIQEAQEEVEGMSPEQAVAYNWPNYTEAEKQNWIRLADVGPPVGLERAEFYKWLAYYKAKRSGEWIRDHPFQAAALGGVGIASLYLAWKTGLLKRKRRKRKK